MDLSLLKVRPFPRQSLLRMPTRLADGFGRKELAYPHTAEFTPKVGSPAPHSRIRLIFFCCPTTLVQTLNLCQAFR